MIGVSVSIGVIQVRRLHVNESTSAQDPPYLIQYKAFLIRVYMLEQVESERGSKNVVPKRKWTSNIRADDRESLLRTCCQAFEREFDTNDLCLVPQATFQEKPKPRANIKNRVDPWNLLEEIFEEPPIPARIAPVII